MLSAASQYYIPLTLYSNHQTTDVQGGKVTFPSTGAELDTEPRTCVSLESALPGEERVVMDSSNQLETFPSH